MDNEGYIDANDFMAVAKGILGDIFDGETDPVEVYSRIATAISPLGAEAVETFSKAFWGGIAPGVIVGGELEVTDPAVTNP